MPLEEVPGETGGPCRSVALAREELGGNPALVSGQVDADELSDRLDVPLEVMELLRLLAWDRAREARADGVDEDEIGDVEERVAVVDDAARWRVRHPVVVHVHAARSECTEMQPHRRRSRAAVEAEHDRASRRVVGVVARVCDVEERRLLFSFLFTQEHSACRGDVCDLLAADRDRMCRLGDLLLEVRWWWGLRGGGALLVLAVVVFRRGVVGHRA